MSQSTLGTGDPGLPFPAADKNTADKNTAMRHTQWPERMWERMWVWLSERINPIVVKEVRQSLKSRQFTISFGLTLIAAVCWTLIAISLSVPRIYYMPGGIPLLSGYFVILTIALMVIIPAGAFMSLVMERQDSTFDLLSISALSSVQIIYGKMASACVQLMLYMSALTPCIVLTYLLRGVSLFTILFILGWTVVFCLCESALALLLAALARSLVLQVIVALVALAGMNGAAIGWTALVLGEGLTGFSNPPPEIYLVLFAVGTVIVAAISLVLRTAAAAIDFPSENNTTPIRKRLLFLLSIALFWSLVGMVASEQAEIAFGMIVGVFIVAMIVGSLMTGELGVISPRAQRTLPKTFIGRVFLTWMYPGAGLGYIFLVCMFAAFAFTLAAVEIYYETTMNNFFGRTSVSILAYMLLCYLAIYLGVNRLLMLAVPKHVPGRMLAAVAMMAVILILAHLVPALTVYYANDYREFDYAWHQAFNIPWSTTTAVDDVSLDIGASILIITLCALGIFGLNLILSTRDVMLVRVAEPPRVREEEAQDEPLALVPDDPFADEPEIAEGS